MAEERFSPRAFMKARRPERFSDSVVETGFALDRSMLEYHLDTLTSRGQETDFERFARRLAEREVCPNLLPQTGPTGGGDSKVDAETYPVADDLSLVWYVGTAREAASERWAFAFSTKKAWRAKVQSDVAKIAATGRGYSKAFFVSNQFIPDRVRAEVEDTLRKKHGLDVRILDRTWILDRVFHGRHEPLAIEELRLAIPLRAEVRKGPMDLQRERELEELEGRIKAASQQGEFGLPFVNDCLEAAELARSLDRPCTEVEGLFLRAQRIADKYGTQHQRLASAYQWAWTVFWWYEDYPLFAELYGEVETDAKGSRNAYDLELLTNLWNGLYASVQTGALNPGHAKLEERTATLAAELERLSQEEDRLSTALQAKTLRLHMQLLTTPRNEVDPLLRELQSVVRQSERLVGYPLDPLETILTELGNVFGDRPAYGDLFETIVEVAATRKGEVTAARMLVDRGTQQLAADQPYEAIKLLGRALTRLYKHESRHDIVRALFLCGSAYERVNLLWAARGTVLTAASIATNDFWTYNDVTPHQAVCYNRLKWLEVKLGRVPQALAWHELDRVVRGVLADAGYDAEGLARPESQFAPVLGILFLKTRIDQLKHLSGLPDVLGKLDLHLSASALCFALGHEDAVPEAPVGDGTDSQPLYDFFSRWRDQPAAAELPASPALYEGATVTLTSNVLGCRITVESDNSSPCVELAESVLAALESLLSTSMMEHVVAREPQLRIHVRATDVTAPPYTFKLEERDGLPHVEVQCGRFDPNNVQTQAQIKDRLFELMVNILARVFLIRDTEQVAQRLFRDELALERAISFTSSFGSLGNVLGHAPKTRLDAWRDASANTYPLQRSEVWDYVDRLSHEEPSDSVSPPRISFGKDEPPADLFDTGRTKHTQMETVSLIREVLWDRAGWSGTAFGWSQDDSSPPSLMLMFGDAVAAGKIFAQWRKELGTHDAQERLRLTIIRGIDRKNPHSYRLVLGVNPAMALSRPDLKYTIVVARINTMNPASDHNVNSFLTSYERFGGYILAHALVPDESSRPVPVWDNYIMKRELHLREAWEIGRHDADSVGIRDDDDPLIPPGLDNPPVLELLRWRRKR